jgi:N-acetyl-alpha-D-glucosaminyl L-malate synthase BshA
MKIGITCYPGAGGSGVVATELGRQLALKNHEVHFISYAEPFRIDRYQKNVLYHEVDTTSYPLFKFPPYSLNLASKMAEVSREYDLDLIHVHYAIPHATCAYLAKQMLTRDGDHQPSIITTLHGTDITLVGSDPGFFDITKFSIESSDGVTAVSKYLADETHEVFSLEKHIEVIPNFFDDRRFKPHDGQCTRSEFANEGEALICHVSNFRPVKRTLDVITVFEQINNQLPAKLVLVGEGPDTVLARRQVAKKGLKDRVIFLGNQSRVEAILPCTDLFLMLSAEESFGLAALEALACGVPVIGTSGTGLTEVITDGENGYLFNVGDTNSMTEGALRLLRDPALLVRFKKAAARIAREKFLAEQVVEHYERYYQEVLHG